MRLPLTQDIFLVGMEVRNWAVGHNVNVAAFLGLSFAVR